MESSPRTTSITKSVILVIFLILPITIELLHDECIGTTFLDDTTLIHLLPRSDCCTTALVNFLVTIHNQFVDICLKLTREMHSFAKTWLVDTSIKLAFYFNAGDLIEETEELI